MMSESAIYFNIAATDVQEPLSRACPQSPWMWASGHSADSVKRAAHGYEPTREAAMAAFAKSWRRQ
jgi:hypothetical protein